MTGQIINSRAEAEQFALLRGFKTMYAYCGIEWLLCGRAMFAIYPYSCSYWHGGRVLWECRYG